MKTSKLKPPSTELQTSTPVSQLQLKPRSFSDTDAITATSTSDVMRKTIAESQPSAAFDFSRCSISAAEDCSSPSPHPSIVQAKLTIGEPDDKYEQEADRVAARVVRQINSPQLVRQGKVQRSVLGAGELMSANCSRRSPLQRKSSVPTEPASSDFESDLQQARGGGIPIASSLRGKMESAIGSDFSSVRLHTDAQSDNLSRSIQAKAFTTGSDVFFKQGEYNPSSRSGQELLAHELTHVVQQQPNTAVRSLIQRDADDGQPVDLPISFSYASFKSDTAIWHAERGEYLSTIDTWLKAAERAQSWDEQQHALEQAKAAADAWLKKHSTTKQLKEPSSVSNRRSAVVKVYEAASIALSADANDSINYSSASAPSEKGTSSGKEKAAKATQVIAKVGGGIYGGTKATQAIAAKIHGEGVSKVYKALGEGGTVAYHGTTALSGAVNTINGFITLCESRGDSTTKEKIAQSLDIAESTGVTTQAGINTGLGVVKTIGEIGNGATTDTVAKLGKAAVIAGIVIGTIQIAQGGFAIYRGVSAKSNIKEGEKQQQAIVEEINTKVQHLAVEVAEALRRQTATPDDHSEIRRIGEELIKLRDILVLLQQEEAKYTPAMAAMKKISNRHMEAGAVKAAVGTLAVVSGALTLSGVGAPIALAIGTLSSLIGLGYAKLNLAADSKAGALTTVAKRLTNDGKPKAEPDQEPTYREMEKRIYKCYYRHIPEVMEQAKPAGLKTDDFTIVKQFAWDDKKSRVQSLDKHIVANSSEARTLSDDTLQNKWIEAQDSNGKVLKKEKPKGWSKAKYKVSASAHRSKRGSIEDMANALFLLCQHSYDPVSGGFIDAPIVPKGQIDDDNAVKTYQNVTLYSLLAAAEITTARWHKWHTKAAQKATASNPTDQDAAKLEIQKIMKEKVKNHLS